MIYGAGAYGSLAYGSMPIGDSQAVADVISSLAAQSPAPDLSYVVRTWPFDPVGGATTLQVLSSDTGPSSGLSVPSTHQHRIVNPYSWEASLPALLTPGSLADIAVGAARFRSSGPILYTGRDLDGWASYNWTDRDYEVYVGESGATWPDGYALIFKGSTDRMEYTHDEIQILFRDLRRRLEVPIQTNLYAGTGGLEGGATIAGLPKPLGWGQVRQVSGVLVDAANQIYQLNDGTMQAVNAARDQGGELAFDADVADITTATPAPGEYATSLATGFVKLGDNPAGTVTFDFQGDNSGTGYVSTVASIVRRIAGGRGGLTDPDDLELGSFVQMDADTPYTVGHYVGPEEKTVLQVIDTILDGVQGWALFTPIGRLEVGRVTDPSGEALDGALTGISVTTEGAGATYKRSQASAAHWRVRSAYKRYYRTLDPDNVDASVSEATKQDYGREWRWVKADDTDVLADIPGASTTTINATPIDSAADAQTEVDRVGALLATERHFHTVELDNLIRLQMFSHQVGNVVTLTEPVYELGAGAKRLIAGQKVNPASRQLVLILWG